MIRLVLLLLLVAACKPQLTQEQLVQQCRYRGGVPIYKAQRLGVRCTNETLGSRSDAAARR